MLKLVPVNPYGPSMASASAASNCVVVVRQSDEHTGQRAGHRRRVETGMLDGLPGGLQQQAVLRIDRGRLALVDPEELGIEAADVVQERAPLRHRPTGHTGLGVVVLVGVPPVARESR